MEQTNHGISVKKRHKGSSSSSSIQKPRLSTKHNNNNPNPNPDLISALPDSLLLHILSLLDTKKVIKTSLLSRRWRYLWKSIPCLCFYQFDYSPDFTNFIDKCLFHHEDSKIQKLHIIYCLGDENEENEPALPNDSWIHFAMKYEVEDFMLHLLDYGYYPTDSIPYDDKLYKLPYTLYMCTTLTSLSLCGCNLNLPYSFRLGSLKKLSLWMIELYWDSIEHFSSNCPLLEDIYLKNCNRGEDLNIVIKNENVKRLEISEFGLSGYYVVQINAPTLLSLGIYECGPDVRFDVEELGSLMSVDLVGESLLLSHYSEEYIDKYFMEEILYDLRHVKNLKLCSLCIQVLSLMKLRSVNLLSISATCLELKASLEKWEFPGISYLLQSCSNLEKLKIVNEKVYIETEVSNKFIEKHDFVEEEYWASFETVVPTIMQNIKYIEIDLGSESRHEEFVRFLLKNAKVLESMIINTPKRYANNFELLFKFTQRLIAFPRSSPNATVIIR